MNAMSLRAVGLRLRLAFSGASPVAAGATLICLLGAALAMWLTQQSELLARKQELAVRTAALPPTAAPVPKATPNENLAFFYAAVGERRYAEQQVKTLFGLAAKTGLVLHEGEYKSGYDCNARLSTYQIDLPVKGSYRAIWQFSLSALRAIPFATLDEISFRRDSIGDTNVEAHLRLTLYLSDAAHGVPQ